MSRKGKNKIPPKTKAVFAYEETEHSQVLCEVAGLSALLTAVGVEPSKTNDKDARIWRAIVSLFILLLIAALTITALSRPAERYVRLSLDAHEYALPGSVVVEVAPISLLRLTGARISMERLTTLEIGGGAEHITLPAPPSLQLIQQKGVPASSVYVEPQGRLGRLQLEIPKGTVMRRQFVTPEVDSISFVPQTDYPVLVSLESETVFCPEAFRVELDPEGLRKRVGHRDPYPLKVTNPVALVLLRASCPSEMEMNILSSREIVIADSGRPLRSHNETAKVSRCRLIELTFKGARDAEISKVLESDIELKSENNTFEWSGIVAPRVHSAADPRLIRISGRGILSSLKQDGRELLPSRLSDYSDADPSEKSVYGALALVLIMFWGVLLKRSVDVIANILIPEPK